MSPEHRRTLETWVRAQNTPQSIALRAKIALLAADGLSNVQIARGIGASRPTVILWRQRFLQGGPDALTEIAPGRGRRATYGADRVKALVEATTQIRPPGATEDWAIAVRLSVHEDDFRDTRPLAKLLASVALAAH